jgi:hypothetical protein
LVGREGSQRGAGEDGEGDGLGGWVYRHVAVGIADKTSRFTDILPGIILHSEPIHINRRSGRILHRQPSRHHLQPIIILIGGIHNRRHPQHLIDRINIAMLDLNHTIGSLHTLTIIQVVTRMEVNPDLLSEADFVPCVGAGCDCDDVVVTHLVVLCGLHDGGEGDCGGGGGVPRVLVFVEVVHYDFEGGGAGEVAGDCVHGELGGGEVVPWRVE